MPARIESALSEILITLNSINQRLASTTINVSPPIAPVSRQVSGQVSGQGPGQAQGQSRLPKPPRTALGSKDPMTMFEEWVLVHSGITDPKSKLAKSESLWGKENPYSVQWTRGAWDAWKWFSPAAAQPWETN